MIPVLFTMTKRVVLSLIVLGVFGSLWSVAPQVPFSIAVVPTQSFGDRGIIAMSHKSPRDFYVVLTNVSREPQVVWE